MRVLAVALLEPAEADEAGDRLVHPLARRADHAGQLLLGDRQHELVAAVGQLEQPLGGAAGDVEEHRVGERLVHRPQPLGEQAGDVPQQLRAARRTSSSTGAYGTASTLDGSSARAIAERGRSSSMPSSPNRSPGSIRATTLSRRSIGLAMAMAMRPARDDVERVGRVALVEQRRRRGRAGARCRPRPASSSVVGVGVGEEVGARQHVPVGGVIVGHDRAGYYPARVTDAARSCGPSSSAAAAATRFGAPKQYEPLGDGRVIDLAVAAARGGERRRRRRRAGGRRRPRARRRRRGDAQRVGARRAGGGARRGDDRVRARRRPSARHGGAVRRGDRRRARRRRRRGARRSRSPTRSRSSTRRARSSRRPTARRSSPCRRRRRSAPTCCAGPTPRAARAPTTPRSSRRSAAGWSSCRASRGTARSPSPTTSTGRARLARRGGRA